MKKQQMQLQLNKKHFMSLFLPPALMNPDAQGLKNIIYDSFKKFNLEKVLSKTVFLASDGASVNSRMK